MHVAVHVVRVNNSSLVASVIPSSQLYYTQVSTQVSSCIGSYAYIWWAQLAHSKNKEEEIC